MKIEITLFDLAQRYVGVGELPGGKDHPLIQWWLSLCGFGMESPDETPWCSAFANGMAWELRLPRSKSAMARSWLAIGERVETRFAQVGFDVVVLKRGRGAQPGPDVLNAPGHVGLFAGFEQDLNGRVYVLGGNQGDHVSVAPFSVHDVLGVRRLVSI